LGLGTNFFVKIPRPGDSEMTISVLPCPRTRQANLPAYLHTIPFLFTHRGVNHCIDSKYLNMMLVSTPIVYEQLFWPAVLYKDVSSVSKWKAPAFNPSEEVSRTYTRDTTSKPSFTRELYLLAKYIRTFAEARYDVSIAVVRQKIVLYKLEWKMKTFLNCKWSLINL